MQPRSPEEEARRCWLARAVFGLGGLISAVLSSSGLGYFLSPAFRQKQASWADLGRAGDFSPGMPEKVEFVERRRDAWVTTEKRSSAWVVTADGNNFTVFDPRCPHLGCPFRWEVQSATFQCPCHTAAFGPDGRVISGPPPRPLDRYETKVAQGRLLVLPEPRQVEP